jgi:hypothetical protein
MAPVIGTSIRSAEDCSRVASAIHITSNRYWIRYFDAMPKRLDLDKDEAGSARLDADEMKTAA